MKGILILVSIIIIILITGAWLYFRFDISIFQPNSIDREWKTYTNNEYSFEFKYPHDWKVEDKTIKSGEFFYPRIYVYKKRESNLENKSDLVIFPKGFPTSLPDDINTQKQESLFAGRKATILKFLTEKGDVWLETILDISDLPNNWDNYAYISIKPKVYNLKWECAVQLLPGEECGYGMGRKYFGDIYKDEYKTIQEILSTFKFTN